jgi:hypothetical protein
MKRQSGLNPIILDGSEIHRLPRITQSSFTECSHVGLFEISMPSLLLIRHILKTFTQRVFQPVFFRMGFFFRGFRTETQ